LPSKPLRHGWRRYFSLASQALYEAASAVSAPEGANATILVDEESYSFDESGRIQHVSHVIYKVLTQKGAEGWDYLSVSWEPWHEARPLIRARVIAPDFSVHELDPNTITEAPARGGDYKTYSDGKRLRAPFPAIAPGVVVEAEYTERETEPLFAPGHVGRIVFGQERVPVEHNRAVFDAPASLTLRIGTLLLPDLKPVRFEASGRVTLTYDLGRLEGIEPQEPNLPPDVATYPEIAFSTGQSWQGMAAEYSKIVDSRANASQVQAILDQLIAGKRGVAEKEGAILDYLDREVRYTGIEWLREDLHLEGGDDPLGGPVFPRFWLKGQAADARKMKLAAASILASTKPTAHSLRSPRYPTNCTVPLPTNSSTRSTQPRSAATLIFSGSRIAAYSPFFSRCNITLPGPGAASAALFNAVSISSVARSKLMRIRTPDGSFTCTSSSA
jgi:hypothetical protein